MVVKVSWFEIIYKLTNDGGETWRRFKIPVDLAAG
jgi:hypothetical protein